MATIKSIEEKARRYDEAIERAKNYHSPETVCNVRIAMENLFPELKESEDERIRNFLIDFIKVCGWTEKKDQGWPLREECIAWLEKQGRLMKALQISNSRIAELVEEKYNLEEKLEKQGEQKPTDKVEPKFKVSDWIIKNDDSPINIDYICCKITKVENGNYTIESIYGYKGYNTFETFEKDYHLWTIQDTKDGDVLCGYPEADYPWIGIFHKLNTEGTFNSHCFLQVGQHGKFCPPSRENIFCKRRNVDNHASENVVPATKEQRDTLMKAMADAGYTFDFERKELKKIEDEYRADAIAEVKDEPQKELAETYLAVFDKKFPILPTLRGKQLADYKNFLNKCQQIFGLKYWGIRPLQAKLFEKLSLLWAAWGAEHLKGLGQTDKDTDNEKQEWSEEDEEMYKEVLTDIIYAKNNLEAKECLGLSKRAMEAFNWFSKRYKSLRPQNTWKPSDEQMEALKSSTYCQNKQISKVLFGLYQDLKKSNGGVNYE